MRLFFCWCCSFWNSLGRTAPSYRGRQRQIAFESLDPRVVLSVTTASVASPLPPAPPAAISDPALAGLTDTALLNATLAKVGPALTIGLASGEYATGLASSDIADPRPNPCKSVPIRGFQPPSCPPH